LFTAARRDHLERRILPALEAGQIVICDRFADSTRMYQGRGGLRPRVDALHDLMIGVEPDLTLLVDMPAEAGLTRAKARATAEERFEDFGLALQQQMREGFLALARDHPARIRVIDGNRPIDTVTDDILATVVPHLP
jgi:dTMP kinase